MAIYNLYRADQAVSGLYSRGPRLIGDMLLQSASTYEVISEKCFSKVHCYYVVFFIFTSPNLAYIPLVVGMVS